MAAKAKELVGAVTGNDELTDDGQLQLAEAEAARPRGQEQAGRAQARAEATQDACETLAEQDACETLAEAEAIRSEAELSEQIAKAGQDRQINDANDEGTPGHRATGPSRQPPKRITIVNVTTFMYLPYRAARAPLALLDAQLLRRLRGDSPTRLALEQVLGSIDEVAGRVLKDERIERRGTDLRRRGGRLAHAKHLESQAADRRSRATQTREKAQLKAVRLRTDARSRQRADLREAAANEAEARQTMTRLTRAQAGTAKRDADVRAARKLEAAGQDRKIAEARATGGERRATPKAKADLSHAAEAKAAARRQRTQAAQLGTVVQAKQRARKST